MSTELRLQISDQHSAARILREPSRNDDIDYAVSHIRREAAQPCDFNQKLASIIARASNHGSEYTIGKALYASTFSSILGGATIATGEPITSSFFITLSQQLPFGNKLQIPNNPRREDFEIYNGHEQTVQTIIKGTQGLVNAAVLENWSTATKSHRQIQDEMFALLKKYDPWRTSMKKVFKDIAHGNLQFDDAVEPQYHFPGCGMGGNIQAVSQIVLEILSQIPEDTKVNHVHALLIAVEQAGLIYNRFDREKPAAAEVKDAALKPHPALSADVKPVVNSDHPQSEYTAAQASPKDKVRGYFVFTPLILKAGDEISRLRAAIAHIGLGEARSIK